MELQIQDLLDSIRKEGIEAANKKAEEILAAAKEQAAQLIKDAEAQAAKIKETAENKAAVLRESAKADAEQAKRDAVLSFKSEIRGEFEKILSAKVTESLSDDTLARLIRTALAGEDISAYRAEVSSVGEGLKGLLAEEIKNGLEICPARNVKAGFRLCAKDGSGYFDCTDDEITQMLMPFFKDIDL